MPSCHLEPAKRQFKLETRFRLETEMVREYMRGFGREAARPACAAARKPESDHLNYLLYATNGALCAPGIGQGLGLLSTE